MAGKKEGKWGEAEPGDPATLPQKAAGWLPFVSNTARTRHHPPTRESAKLCWWDKALPDDGALHAHVGAKGRTTACDGVTQQEAFCLYPSRADSKWAPVRSVLGLTGGKWPVLHRWGSPSEQGSGFFFVCRMWNKSHTSKKYVSNNVTQGLL